jgi:hypothetical protein
MRKQRPNIESDTPIVPRAIAEAVWEEACVWLDERLPRRWLRQLIARANTVYARNPRFRRTLRAGGNSGRDWLWAFMRHWLGALIWRHRPELHGQLPQSFNAGHSLPPRPVRSARQSSAFSRSSTRRPLRSDDRAVRAAAHFHFN